MSSSCRNLHFRAAFRRDEDIAPYGIAPTLGCVHWKATLKALVVLTAPLVASQKFLIMQEAYC